MDLATLLLAWLTQLLLLTGVQTLRGYDFSSSIGIALEGLRFGGGRDCQDGPLYHHGSGDRAGAAFLG